VRPAHILAGDTSWVANQQGSDLLLHSKGDHLLGGLMLCLMDPTAMACLHTPDATSVTPPAPRPALTRLGSSLRRLGVAGLLVAQVEIALGAERPTGYEQPRLTGHRGIWMDDAKVNPGHLAKVHVLLLDGDSGSDCEPQPASIGQQRDRPNLLSWVGKGAGQPYPQLGMALGDRQPHSRSLHPEGAVVPANWDKLRFRRGNPEGCCWLPRLAAWYHASL
jgi:hypothetical protein